MVDRWRSLLHATTDVVGADAGNLTRVSGADLEVLLVTGPGRQLYRPGERIRLDGLELQRGRLARAVVTPEPANDTTWRRAPDASRGMIAYMGLSLLWPNGNPFGTIDFHYRKPKTPDQVSERFFALIGKLLEDDLARIFADSQRAEIERQRRIEIDRMSFAAAAGGAGVWDFNIDTGALHGDDRWYDILGLDPAQRSRRSKRSNVTSTRKTLQPPPRLIARVLRNFLKAASSTTIFSALFDHRAKCAGLRRQRAS